jgi:hypothetical protein
MMAAAALASGIGIGTASAAPYSSRNRVPPQAIAATAAPRAPDESAVPGESRTRAERLLRQLRREQGAADERYFATRRWLPRDGTTQPRP